MNIHYVFIIVLTSIGFNVIGQEHPTTISESVTSSEPVTGQSFNQLPSNRADLNPKSLLYKVMHNLDEIKFRRKNTWQDLSNFNLESLEGLESIPNLGTAQVLALYNNPLKSISVGTFKGMPHLQTLTLNNTHLEKIEPGSFAALKMLKTLNLDDNPELKTVNRKTFEGLTNLETLYLNRTGLTTLDADTFADTPNLQILFLHENKFTNLDPAVFAKLPKLQSVNLMKNPLTDESKQKIRSALEARGVKVLF